MLTNLPDLRQTPQYNCYLQSTGWQVDHITYKNTPIHFFIKSLGPLGTILKIQRPPRLPLAQIKTAIRKYHPMLVKIEPNTPDSPNPLLGGKQLKTNGFSPDSWPLLPSRTVVTNLQPPLKTLRANFKKDARYCLKKAEQNNLTIKLGDSQIFFNNWKLQARKKHLWTPSETNFTNLIKAFGTQALILNCYTSNVTTYQTPAKKPRGLHSLNSTNMDASPGVKSANKSWLAGVVLLTTNTTAYYYYASSNKFGRKLHAPYLLIWESLKLAKNKKLKFFDFEGIVDPRFKSTKKWAGFSHFKQSFGGQIIEYPGSYSKYFGPLGKLLQFSQAIFG